MVGGEVTTVGEFPFSVLIGKNEKKFVGRLPGGKKIYKDKEVWKCSGVLLNNQFVLTAGHCKTDDDIFKLRVGVHKLSKQLLGADSTNSENLPEFQNFDVKPENFVIHEDFIPGVHPKNDIALVKLPRPVTFNQLAQPACWRNQSSINIDDKLVVVGWGKINSFSISLTENGVYSDNQYKLEVKET